MSWYGRGQMQAELSTSPFAQTGCKLLRSSFDVSCDHSFILLCLCVFVLYLCLSLKIRVSCGQPSFTVYSPGWRDDEYYGCQLWKMACPDSNSVWSALERHHH